MNDGYNIVEEDSKNTWKRITEREIKRHRLRKLWKKWKKLERIRQISKYF